MRYLFPILLFLFAGPAASGQDGKETREGWVSFITSQSVYVKFSSTKGISMGDTLYIKDDGSYIPSLQIRNLSSISCVCISLTAKEFKVSDIVYAQPEPSEISEVTQEQPVSLQVQAVEMSGNDSLSGDSTDHDKVKQEIYGRLSVSSYSNFYGNETASLQRMRYTFSMHANNLRGSGLSAESYISFVHSNTNWEDVKDNIFSGLKIYNLSLKYDFTESFQLSFGRKINPNLSTVGAIDGMQLEKELGSFTLGAIAGSRPDYTDFSINPELLQYGIYLGHELRKPKAGMNNSLAFLEQTNQFITDRRFVYFQHNSWFTNSLNFFGSAEMDLYKMVKGTRENTFNLTNIYLSLRYKIISPLSVGLTYSSRQNIIYYETYKDIVERLLENEARQGWRFRINSRPVKYLALGISAGYRYRKEDPQPSRHVYAYATYSQVPWINVSLTLSTTLLETSYLKGNIYSLGMSRDIIPGKLSCGLKLRYVDYLFLPSENQQAQNIMETNLSWRVYRKLSISAYYEGTFEPRMAYNRLYVNISQRF